MMPGRPSKPTTESTPTSRLLTSLLQSKPTALSPSFTHGQSRRFLLQTLRTNSIYLPTSSAISTLPLLPTPSTIIIRIAIILPRVALCPHIPIRPSFARSRRESAPCCRKVWSAFRIQQSPTLEPHVPHAASLAVPLLPSLASSLQSPRTLHFLGTVG